MPQGKKVECIPLPTVQGTIFAFRLVEHRSFFCPARTVDTCETQRLRKSQFAGEMEKWLTLQISVRVLCVSMHAPWERARRGRD